MSSSSAKRKKKSRAELHLVQIFALWYLITALEVKITLMLIITSCKCKGVWSDVIIKCANTDRMLKRVLRVWQGLWFSLPTAEPILQSSRCAQVFLQHQEVSYCSLAQWFGPLIKTYSSSLRKLWHFNHLITRVCIKNHSLSQVWTRIFRFNVTFRWYPSQINVHYSLWLPRIIMFLSFIQCQMNPLIVICTYCTWVLCKQELISISVATLYFPFKSYLPNAPPDGNCSSKTLEQRNQSKTENNYSQCFLCSWITDSQIVALCWNPVNIQTKKTTI